MRQGRRTVVGSGLDIGNNVEAAITSWRPCQLTRGSIHVPQFGERGTPGRANRCLPGCAAAGSGPGPDVSVRAGGRARAWDENADPFTNAVRVAVMTLCRKLGQPPVIETVPRRPVTSSCHRCAAVVAGSGRH